MGRRSAIAGGLLAAGIVSILLAKAVTYPVSHEGEYVASYSHFLLFGPAAWLIPLSALLGVFLRGSCRGAGVGSVTDGGKVLRHDTHMYFSHWIHVLSVLLLAGSGVAMGVPLLPRAVHTQQTTAFALNLHFVGVVLFVFGLSYHAGDLLVKGGVKELWPKAHDFSDALAYYGSKCGKGLPPPQDKYLSSERLSFPLWLVILAVMIITGGIKTAAHLWSLSSLLMAKVTLLHDVGTLCLIMLVFLHVLLGAVVPWSWPLLRSMVTGYMDEAYVRENHVLWYNHIQEPEEGGQ